MDELVVSTDVYVAPAEAYEFLLEFPRYDRYTEYLDHVSRTHGDGGPGTRYALRFAWWKLSYTARSEVTDVTPPARIDWRVRKDIDARGAWVIDPLDELPEDAPDDAEAGSRVRLEIQFDPDSADASSVSLPPLVSFDWVLEKVKGLVTEEAERVVRRAVVDLEGSEREVSLTVRTDADSL